MRGQTDGQGPLFVVLDAETLVPADHPLRAVKRATDAELARMRRAFNAAYAKVGRPSIPPEQLIKATLLQALYSIRSERQLCEQIGYNFLFRWFLDLALDAPVWNHSTFSKNRERFAEHDLMRGFFEGSVARGIAEQAASVEHFSVDGTLIEAWASMKSVRRKDGSDEDDTGHGDSNRWTNWHGEKRSNETHASTTDPEARLMRKGRGQEARLSHSMHVLMENRNGLVMDIELDEANGTAERQCATRLLKRAKRRHRLRPETVGLDKGYEDGQFLHDLENSLKVKPHVATKAGPIRSTDTAAQARLKARRRQRTLGYQLSQRCRKKIEEIFGWMKTIGGLRKTRFIGRWKTQLYAYAAAAIYNLMRLTRLSTA